MSDRRRWTPHPQSVLSLGLVILFAWVIFEGWGWPDKTRLFPMVIGFPMLGLAVFQLWKDISRRVAAPPDAAEKTVGDGGSSVASLEMPAIAAAGATQDALPGEGLAHASGRKIAAVVAQMLAYFAGMYLIGFVEVVPVYTALYLRFAAREPWWRAIALAIIIWGFTWGLFVRTLHLPFTTGLIVELIQQNFL